MTREEVWEHVSSFLARGFGRLLDVRDVRRVRRVAGAGWTVTVVLTAPSGELHVADVVVDEAGAMTPELDGDAVIAAVTRAQTVSKAPPPPSEDLGDLGDFGADEGGDALALLEMADDPPDVRVENALKKGDPASLREARELLPRMLADHETRGATLFTMADVEARLANTALAKSYLEAAAREFADRFDMASLERSAGLALALLGRESFAGSPVHALLEASRARLTPAEDLFACRSFAGLPDAARDGVRAMLEPHVALQTLAPGEDLVVEGAPSKRVFVVKSGLVGVWLEKASGGQWLVRCCFPGWLLGESSVLGEGDPRCTATLRAERVSDVWALPAASVRAAMDAFPAFAERIAATKQLHRIDSFFSMHETMGQLDVQVRDDMLSCIQRLETFDADAVLLAADAVPEVACLVARGEIALFERSKRAPRPPVATVGADAFYGVRDAIHQIASPFDAVARAGTTVAFFDAERLRALCSRSAEHVIAILERLG